MNGMLRSVARSVAAAGLALSMTAATVAVAAAPVEAQRGHVSFDRQPVFEIGDETAVTGRSWLLRTDRGIFAVLRTGRLVRGDAYTVWAVVFNEPGGCIDGCDAGDLANPAAEAVSMPGGGRVAPGRRATFVVRVPAGADLTDPHGAEIHFVVRTHGPAIPGLVHEQITTLNGGCPPNTCANLLMAKHE